MPDYFGLTASAIRGFFAAMNNNIKNYGKSYYSQRLHPNVYFAPLAFADKHCQFEGAARIKYNSDLRRVTMGRHSFCSANCQIYVCEIGRYCSIGPEVRIGLGVHPTQYISTYPGFYSPQKHSAHYYINPDIKEFEKTIIGHDVWIGSRVIIPGGVTIGDGAIIGAGAVVTKDVAPYSIMGGVPARLIRQRFSEEEIELLLRFRWWERDEEFLHRHGHLFTDTEKFFTFIREELNETETQA